MALIYDGQTHKDLTTDINALALKDAITENRVAYNLPNMMIEQFQDDSKLGTETDGDRNASEYWSPLAPGKTYQSMSTTRANMTIGTGSWTGSATNDYTSSPAGTGGDYPSSYVNYIYDLSRDWKVKLFTVARGDGDNDLYENWMTWNCLITTDTSVAAGADTATSSADGRAWRQTDTSSDTGTRDFKIGPTEWGDYHLTAAYAATIGSDSATDNSVQSTFGHQQINCGSGSSPWITSCYSFNVNAYGILVEYDQDANTILVRQPTNTAWSSFSTNKTTFSNVPATGRFFFHVGGGNGQQGRTVYHSTTYKDNALTDRGYAYEDVVNATGTLISTAQTANAAQTKVSGVILYKNEEGTATLGTDLKIYFTCNGGTNWTESTPTAAGTFSSGILMAKCPEVTCTSGTDIRYKAVWANQLAGSKETQLHGIGMNY